jgi:hypothetical protein
MAMVVRDILDPRHDPVRNGRTLTMTPGGSPARLPTLSRS